MKMGQIDNKRCQWKMALCVRICCIWVVYFLCVNNTVYASMSENTTDFCSQMEKEYKEKGFRTFEYEKIQLNVPKEEEFTTRNNPFEKTELTQEEIMQEELTQERLAVYSAKYDPRLFSKITGIKTQVSNTCWVYAAVAQIESNLLFHGYENKGLDLSELHALFFAKRQFQDVMGLYTENRKEYTKSLSQAAFEGGVERDVYSPYSRWIGPVYEREAPMVNSIEAYDEVELGQELTQKGMYYLTNVRAARYDHENVEMAVLNLKEIIQIYAGASIGYYSGGGSDFSNYRKVGEDYCYYYPVKRAGDHMVEVVGWDDDFDKNNFKNTPQKNGAWLIKNSWGEIAGTSGYCWLSYYDQTIDSYMAADFTFGKPYEHMYTYGGEDDEIVNTQQGTQYFLNTYKISGNKRGISQSVKAIMASLEAGHYYEFTVFSNPVISPEGTVVVRENIETPVGQSMEDTKSILAGDKSETVYVYAKYDGLYTISFEKNVIINTGDIAGIYVKTDGNIGTSYTKEAIGNSYRGTSPEHINLMRYSGTWDLRLLTNDCEEDGVNGLVYSIETSFSCPLVILKEDRSTTNLAQVWPQNASAGTNVIYKSSDETVASVDENGTITAHSYGSCEIIAASMDGKTKDVCTVNVCCSNISFAKQSYELKKGEERNVSVIFPKEYEAVDEDIIEYVSDNPQIASVDKDGKVIAKTGGKTQIHAILKKENNIGANTDLEASCDICVTARAESVEIKISKDGKIWERKEDECLEIMQGESFFARAVVYPEDTTDKSVIYKVYTQDKKTPATGFSIDEDGKVTALEGYRHASENSDNGEYYIEAVVRDSLDSRPEKIVHEYQKFHVYQKVSFDMETAKNRNIQLSKYGMDYVRYVQPDQFYEWMEERITITSSDCNVVNGFYKEGKLVLCYKQKGKAEVFLTYADDRQKVSVCYRITCIDPEEKKETENLVDVVENKAGNINNADQNITQEQKKDEEILKKGTIIKRNSGVYKVISAQKVMYVLPGKKSIKKISIPGYIYANAKPYKVVSIRKEAFKNCRSLTKVTLSDPLTSIGKKAFYGCKNLKKVTLGKNIKSIGKDAFKNCNKKLKFIYPEKKKKLYKKLLLIK